MHAAAHEHRTQMDYESARGALESAKRTLNTSLDDFASKVRDVELSCNRPSVGRPLPQDPYCRLIVRNRRRLTDAKLLELCKKGGKS